MGKILITGAGGFIGSHLVDLLLKEEGCERLRLFVKTGEKLNNLPDENFDIVYGDIRNKKSVKKAMVGVDTVYHLAARIDFDGKTYSEYEDVNVRGTQNLIDECKGRKISKFIFFSSIGVYGLPAGIGEIKGWDETHPKTYTNYYGRSKLEGEEAIIRAHNEFGLPFSIIRPASVYGPREIGPTYALYKSIKDGRFAMIGDGQNLMHYIYVKDLVDAARKGEKSGLKASDYIIAGEKAEKFEDIVRYIGKSINVKIPAFSIPRWVALVISHPLGFIKDLTGLSMPLFPSRVKTMTTTYYYDISRAKMELGWRPKVSFEKGSRITGKWYQENGYL